MRFLDWLAAKKDGLSALGVIVTIIATVIGGIWAWEKDQKPENSPVVPPSAHYTARDNQINAPIIATNGGEINIVATHHHGLAVDDAMTLAKQLAAAKGEKDAQIIKSLQETIQALQQQNADKYNIQQAFDLLEQGNTAQAEDIFAAVAEEARSAGKQANVKKAKALRHLGSLAFLHDTQKAFDAYFQSTKLDPNNLDGWNQLGNLYRRIGELEKSEIAYMTVQKLASDDRFYQAVAYNNLGTIYQTRGELDKAIEYRNKALAIYEPLGHKQGMAGIYGNLGIVYQTRGELDKAIDYYNKALAIYEPLGHKQGMAYVYGNLGTIYQTRGELDKAIEYLRKSLALFTEIGMKPQMAQAQSLLDSLQLEH